MQIFVTVQSIVVIVYIFNKTGTMQSLKRVTVRIQSYSNQFQIFNPISNFG